MSEYLPLEELLKVIQEERTMLKKFTCSDTTLGDYATYANLYISENKVSEVLKDTSIEEWSKRKFIQCLIHKLYTYSKETQGRLNLWQLNVATEKDQISVHSVRSSDYRVVHAAMVTIFGLNKLISMIPNFQFSYCYVSYCGYQGEICESNSETSNWILDTIKGISFYDAIEDDLFDKYTYYNLFMQIINALYIAYKEIGFIHGDLSTKNIVIEKLEKPIHIPFYIGQKSHDGVLPYITTDHVAHIVYYPHSRVVYNGKDYSINNKIPKDYNTGLPIYNCISDLYHLFATLLYDIRINKITSLNDILPIFIAAYNSAIKDDDFGRFDIEREITEKEYKYLQVSNPFVKANESYTHLDFYEAIIYQNPTIHDTDVIFVPQQRESFESSIYNHKKLYDIHSFETNSFKIQQLSDKFTTTSQNYDPHDFCVALDAIQTSYIKTQAQIAIFKENTIDKLLVDAKEIITYLTTVKVYEEEFLGNINKIKNSIENRNKPVAVLLVPHIKQIKSLIDNARDIFNSIFELKDIQCVLINYDKEIKGGKELKSTVFDIKNFLELIDILQPLWVMLFDWIAYMYAIIKPIRFDNPELNITMGNKFLLEKLRSDIITHYEKTMNYKYFLQ